MATAADPRSLVGRRVRFAPNLRWPGRTIDATVVRHRLDSYRIGGLVRVTPRVGFLDTVDDAVVERSVRPSRVEVL